MQSLFASSLRFFLCASCTLLSCSSLADKYQWEPYPWPNAEYPSREKPMRRDLSEPLQFGEKEDRPMAKTPTKKSPAAKKKPAVKAKPPVKAKRPKTSVAPNNDVEVQGSSAVPPPLPNLPPESAAPVAPSNVPTVPPDETVRTDEAHAPMTFWEFVSYVVVFALTVFTLIILS